MSLLNLADPFLFGKKFLNPVFGSIFKDWLWNANLRHHLTPFGYNLGLNVFLERDQSNLFTTLNYYANKDNNFFGIDVAMLRYPVKLEGIPLQASMRTSLWVQPESQSFYRSKKSFGYLASIKAYYALTKNFETFFELMNKHDGWVPGEVSLSRETAFRLGLAYHIRQH